MKKILLITLSTILLTGCNAGTKMIEDTQQSLDNIQTTYTETKDKINETVDDVQKAKEAIAEIAN